MIKIIKLVTGEEIVADVTEQDQNYTLEKPVVLQLIASRSIPEQPQMALIPYAGYTEFHCVTVKKDHVVWSEEPMKELYNQYNSIFGNGIVVANQSVLN